MCDDQEPDADGDGAPGLAQGGIADNHDDWVAGFSGGMSWSQPKSLWVDDHGNTATALVCRIGGEDWAKVSCTTNRAAQAAKSPAISTADYGVGRPGRN